jgi:hypothetical protein
MRTHAAETTYSSILHNNSSTIIQRRVRGHFVRRHDRLNTSMEAVYRLGFRVRGMLVQHDLTAKQQSAVAIQCVWRVFDARALTVGHLARKHCLILQAVTRGWLLRRDGFLKVCWAACLRIQATVRGFLARTGSRKNRHLQSELTVFIESTRSQSWLVKPSGQS